ncbi:transcriptional regulator [Candidatus Falkowbacteria bacterium RIFOXYB2_FULL_47_14]|uniref:Probable transcriptional regulatory protein A2227_00185 n=1 Tax=Candidatus Falkowbacteria bacterium RIFOXYA2_FULL_47_19 TaxID=1797994 RepID=A0A1F5SFX0_9BACT|nr:MAG: transcriptional regulator [Candidatus Falkowbacteria bacterium RIFOXYA2_FULL_47_19]OGF35576.1 MAG: transcriptional regulator [Candidatus Falkowbacteria bacterium RIFOXYC2_FULL_46_15]OGF42940.1 MAG: transcriptional regulator [Candidatus Falkowbacteria bacterium RIFOXYB2_FULL_47_14]
MSGHSKWATTKRRKEAVDAKRGAIFTRVAHIITLAARKGGDPESNFNLRMAMEKAKGVNMPKDNIERAIKRGTGELGGAQIEELIYEGFGPAGSQFIVKSLTDNKNRSAGNIRHLFTKYGGSLGAVMWSFELAGVVRIDNEETRAKNLDWDGLELELIDAGAQDIRKEEEGVTVVTKPEDLQRVNKFFEEKNITVASAEAEYLPKEEITVSPEDKEKIENFIDELEDNEDVSDYYHNISNV